MSAPLVLLCCLLVASASATLRIGSFNVQIFGQQKAQDVAVMNILARIVKRYDILLIQEVRDSSDTAILALLAGVNAQSRSIRYSNTSSTRLGRTLSMEQYVFLYRTDRVTIADTYQYGDPNDEFEREPFAVKLHRNAATGPPYDLALIALHAEPGKAVAEMESLVAVHSAVSQTWRTDNILIMGDLNAACNYASKKARNGLTLRKDPKFSWLIDDDVDTTVGNSDCAYDRMIASGRDLRGSLNAQKAGVFRFDVEYKLNVTQTAAVSDHYPIEVDVPSSRPLTAADSEASDSTNNYRSCWQQSALTVAAVAFVVSYLARA